MSNLEKHILGACFHPEAVAEVVQSVSAEDFTEIVDQKIFSIIERLIARGVQPEPQAITAEDTSINLAYLMEVEGECFTVANIKFYLDKFADATMKKRYLGLSRTLSGMANRDTTDIRLEIEKTLSVKTSSTSEHVSKPLNRAFKQMEDAYNTQGAITGVATGISKIDEELSGLHKTDMVLIAARPSIGKTALALQIAEHACVKNKVPTLFITLEMSGEQLASRMCLSKAKISVSKARNGLFKEADWGRLTMSAGEINGAKFFIDDCAGASIEVIAAKAKAEKMRNNIGLLVVDYLGLVTGKGTEYERVTNASRSIKILAKQLDVPVVVLHQLNRSGTGRPTMNELRSSGQLEQDADIILLLHREKKEPTEPCEIIIEKNRHGKTGIIKQTWVGHLNRIEENYEI